VILALLMACSACAVQGTRMCAEPAQVFGTDVGDGRGGWVLVRPEKSVEETARRIARTYHVAAEPLRYSHGFNIYPIPSASISKLRCDKSILEIHYAGTTKNASDLRTTTEVSASDWPWGSRLALQKRATARIDPDRLSASVP